MTKEKKEVVATKEWVGVCEVYNVLEICDAGMVEVYEGDERVDCDDLRIALLLSGNHKVLIPPKARIVIRDNGAIVVEILK